MYNTSQWDNKNIKLSILVPTRDTVTSQFAYCLSQLMKINSQIGIDTFLFFNSNTILLNQREMLVEDAKKIKSDYVLWLDSDMVFPPTTAMRLLNHNKDIVGCNYLKRSKPNTPVAYETLFEWDKPLSMTSKDDLVKVEGVGLGCILMKLSVFDSICKPYFEFSYILKTKEWMGEDFNLLGKLRSNGHEVYIDTVLSNEVKHIGSYAY
jgi:hypothetical protein